MIHARLISGCDRNLQNGAVSPWFSASSRKPSSILESQDLKPTVIIEVFLSRGHVDVEGFLEWQFSRVFGLVHHYGHFQSDGVVILPNTLLLLTSPASLSGRHPGASLA